MKDGMVFNAAARLLALGGGTYEPFVPPPIDPYLELPRWLHQRIKEKIPAQEIRDRWHGVNRYCREYWFQNEAGKFPHGHRWLDHFGVSTYEQGGEKLEAFVAEPYGLDEPQMRSIIHITERLDLRFDIRAGSSHYPTRALRILFYPPDFTDKRVS